MIITNIEQQKNNQERYSIYIDGEFEVGVHQEIIIELGLYKNQDITKQQLEQIKMLENQHKVMDKALNYLSYGLRSVQEMRLYLQKQSFDVSDKEAIIEYYIKRLSRMGYLNDLEYAKSYVRTAASLHAKGPQLIQQELTAKGVDPLTILDGLEEYSIEQQRENIIKLRDKYVATKSKYPPAMMRKQVYQHLLRKGYPKELINEILADTTYEEATNKEEAMLDKEASKLLNRNKKKYQGYPLKQRIFSGLYSKGFNMDLINQWISQHEEEFEVDEA